MNELTLGDYVAMVESLIHDSTGSAWTRGEIVRRINDARKDVSLDCQCTRSLVTGVQLIKCVETYSYDGAVAGAHMVHRGENYGGRHADVTFSPPPAGGVRAEAIAHVKQHHHHDHFEEDEEGDDDRDHDHDHHDWRCRHERIKPGQIEWIEMIRWGERYTQVPTITITDPKGTGSGAVARPVTLFNVINLLSLTPLWHLQRYSLSYKPFTIFQAWARALQAQGFTSLPQIFTIHNGDQLVYVQPTPNQHLFSEWDVIKLASPLVGITDVDRDIPDPWAQCVQFKAAHYLLLKHQNFQQAEYYQVKYDQRVPRVVAGAGGIRIANPYSRSFFEKMRRA